MIPCYVDNYYPQVGISTVRILERLGHTVDCPRGFTCCGQPPFNAGCQSESRAVAKGVLDQFEAAEAIVVPSGSCATMVRVFYADLFKDSPDQARAADLAGRIFELSDFLVNQLGITDLGARFDARATFHDGCHGLRELNVKREPRVLLANVAGLELQEMDECETCCGFGGMFAVKFQEVSIAMAEVKSASVDRTGADVVISGDVSCLMHLEGYFRKQGRPTRCLHLAEVLDQT